MARCNLETQEVENASMNQSGFEDLKDEINDTVGVSQARVGSRMGYRPDEFSRVMNGHQPPKGGLTAAEFRAEVRKTLAQLRKPTVAA